MKYLQLLKLVRGSECTIMIVWYLKELKNLMRIRAAGVSIIISLIMSCSNSVPVSISSITIYSISFYDDTFIPITAANIKTITNSLRTHVLVDANVIKKIAETLRDIQFEKHTDAIDIRVLMVLHYNDNSTKTYEFESDGSSIVHQGMKSKQSARVLQLIAPFITDLPYSMKK